MKNFLVTLYHDDSPEKLGRLSEHFRANYDFWACEYDEGLFFISSRSSAREIAEDLQEVVELNLGTTLFVFELTNNWAMAAGTTNTERALSGRIPPE